MRITSTPCLARGLMSLLFAVGVAFAAQAQERTVSGTVTSDESGEPLPGVNVLVKGTTVGTVTNIDGEYRLQVPEDAETLTFSFIGLQEREESIAGRSSINVTMKESAQQLQEVVVTGYTGTIREDLSSSISTVSSEVLDVQNPSLSVDQMLQGQAAGVSVTGANGRPGNTAFVRIRGVSSIQGGQDPLYIVDGVPLDASNVNNINPQDIESISVLKDAASASLYGSRAANGVVVITTKSGKAGDAKVTVRTSYGIAQRVPDNFDLMNTADAFRYEQELAVLGVTAAESTPGGGGVDAAETAVLRTRDTNWEDELLQNGAVQNYSVGIQGGNERASFFFSLAYDENEGIIQRIPGFERYSARLNSSYQVRDWLRVGANVNVSYTESGLERDRNNVQNPFRAFYQYKPYATVFVQDDNNDLVLDENGDPQFFFGRGVFGYNIAEALITNPELQSNLVTIGNVTAEATFLNDFSYTMTIGASNNRFTRETYLQPGNRLDFFVGDPNNPGSKTDNGSNDFRYVFTNLLSYNKTLGEKHDISANALFEFNERQFSNYSLTSRGFPSDRLSRQAVAGEPTAASTNGTSNALVSYGGFVNYSYDGRYLASASVRADGSSRFGVDNRFGTFFSVSGGWNIAKESFFTLDFVNSLKLRASYGTTGNQDIGDFESLNLIEFDSRNGSSVALPVGVADPNLQWELQELINAGIDFSMFDGRVNGMADYFRRQSSQLLSSFPLSRTTGDEDNTLVTNVGEINSQGVELQISYDLIRRNDFNLQIGGNGYFLDTEVINLQGGSDLFRGFDPPNIILREGQEINTFFLVRYAGVNPETGAPQYLDAEGEITETFSGDDAVALEGKSTQPRFEGGFFTSLYWKGLDFRADAVFREGNYIYNNQYAALINDGSDPGQNQSTDAFNYWKNPGDTDVLPNPIFFTEANQTSDRFLQKGDFIRLRNVTLGYSLPAVLLDRVGIGSLRIFVQGNNLLIFRPHFKGDPEVGIASDETLDPTDADDRFDFVPGNANLFSYPQTRSITAGLSIEF